jgi:putative peptidoglycan lipid II flippase
MAPMALGLMVLAEPIVSLIYQRGAFDQNSVCWTARAVIAYAPGLLAFSAAKTVVPIFYAFKDLKTPVRVASWCILGNFALNLLSVLLLPEGWRHVGIAVSTCVNALVNTVILFTILSRRGITIHIGALSWVGIKALLAATLMGGAAYGVYSLLINYLPACFALMTAIAVGGGAYLLLVPSCFLRPYAKSSPTLNSVVNVANTCVLASIKGGRMRIRPFTSFLQPANPSLRLRTASVGRKPQNTPNTPKRTACVGN